MEKNRPRELQLLVQSSTSLPSEAPKSMAGCDPTAHPLPDLNLSMSVGTPWPSAKEETDSYARKLQVLRQHTAEQIRLAAVEQAYIERTRELTRRELESAKKEFARAKLVWERAREEVEKAERLKEIATRRVSSTCMEITCQSCHQPFQA
ncbi:hypothetical protein ZIOFF_069403 [Zingiber officinale]|uniref:Uncharacterized protein n=1 Tax=Zingiber officinale TaxID=94328 RepID=A0A8J5EPW3_ZINOF|nr:hypothetical protein ZIOFF_069403 [Zingiber officinale]